MGKHYNVSRGFFSIGSFMAGIVLASGVDERSSFLTSNQYQQTHSGQVVKPVKQKTTAEKEAFYEQIYRWQ